MSAEKERRPYVLVMGGTGFIGRNLVKWLVDNKQVKKVVVADKTMPAVASMLPHHKEAFEHKRVIFKQSDLSRKAHVERVFKEVEKFDYVINLCGETRFGMKDADYESKCTAPASAVAEMAAGKIKKWVEVSTAQVYKSDKSPSNEDAKLGPWTALAKYRLKAEEAVNATKDLPVVTLRPAYVYGSGDKSSLSPRITCAAVYQEKLKKKMKFLWSKQLLYNTVHVDDVVLAIWAAAKEGKPGSVYNLADETNTSQETLAKLLSSVFKIDTGFLGMMASNVVKMKLDFVAQVANDDHVPGWMTLCNENKILNSPLSPYVDAELLKNNNLCVDGTRICKELGLKYTVPKLTEKTMKKQIKEFIAGGQFPDILK